MHLKATSVLLLDLSELQVLKFFLAKRVRHCATLCVESRLYLTAEHFALLISDQVERYQGQRRHGSTDTFEQEGMLIPQIIPAL